MITAQEAFARWGEAAVKRGSTPTRTVYSGFSVEKKDGSREFWVPVLNADKETLLGYKLFGEGLDD